MRLFKKGQGATEYLLMLAAVLVIVAIAVYYVTSAPGAPTIIASARLDTTANTVWLVGETGCSTVASWSFEYQKSGDATWSSKSGVSIGPGDEIELTALAGNVSLGDVIKIRYDTTVKELTVQTK